MRYHLPHFGKYPLAPLWKIFAPSPAKILFCRTWGLYFSVEKMAEFAVFVFSISILVLYLKLLRQRKTSSWAAGKGCAQKVLIGSAENKKMILKLFARPWY